MEKTTKEILAISDIRAGGYLSTKFLEVKPTKKGGSYAKFSISKAFQTVDGSYQSEYISCMAFDKDVINKIIELQDKEGIVVLVQGRYTQSTNKETKKTYVKIMVDNLLTEDEYLGKDIGDITLDDIEEFDADEVPF